MPEIDPDVPQGGVGKVGREGRGSDERGEGRRKEVDGKKRARGVAY